MWVYVYLCDLSNGKVWKTPLKKHRLKIRKPEPAEYELLMYKLCRCILTVQKIPCWACCDSWLGKVCNHILSSATLHAGLHMFMKYRAGFESRSVIYFFFQLSVSEGLDSLSSISLNYSNPGLTMITPLGFLRQSTFIWYKCPLVKTVLLDYFQHISIL